MGGGRVITPEPARSTLNEVPRGEVARRWFLGTLALASAFAFVDAVVAHEAVLIGFLAVSTLVAAARLGPRRTGVVAAYTVVLAVVLGVPDDIFGDTDHLTRIAAVAAVGALAVWIAAARSRAEAARRRFELIAAASELVQSSLDPEVAMIEVARMASREVADWCFVFVAADDGTIRQLAAVHRDPARQRLAWDLLMRYPVDPERDEGPARVIRTGEAILYERVDDSALEAIALDDGNLELLRALDVTSAMIAPLVARERTLGAIAFAATPESGRVYDTDDLEIAVEIAARVSAAVEQARLYEDLSRAEADVRWSRDELRVILDGVADGVTVQGPDGQLVYANEVAVRSMAAPSLEALLQTPLMELMDRFELMDEYRQPFPLMDLPGRRALAGEDPEPTLVLFRDKRTGAERWSMVKATPIRDEAKGTRIVVNVIEDVTVERRYAEAQRFLAETGGVLTESLDFETTLARVARLAVPRIADWCSVDVIDDAGEPVRVAVVHEDPAKVEILEELDRRHRSVAVVVDTLRTERAELHADVGPELLARSATGPEHLSVLMQLGFRSTIVAPMRTRGRTLGTITLSMAESGRRFDEEDLRLAEELAGRCGLAVENALLYRQRSRIARTLQESLLPPHLPDLPGLEVGARFRAAGAGDEVGGDFYDLVYTGEGESAAVIGDVCGKGVEAATVTALARYTVRAALMREDSPARVLELLNEALLGETGNTRFCTVLCARLEPAEAGMRVRFASGGHPLPLVLRAAGGAAEVGEPGTLLGIAPDPSLFDESATLGPGDAVVLYTDGITEAAAPERVMTPEEVAAFAGSPVGESAEGIAERVLAGALRASGGRPRDDLAVLVLKVPERR